MRRKQRGRRGIPASRSRRVPPREVRGSSGFNLPKLGNYGVGQVFLPHELVARHEAERAFEKVVRDYGMVVLGWRDVPVNEKLVGPTP